MPLVRWQSPRGDQGYPDLDGPAHKKVRAIWLGLFPMRIGLVRFAQLLVRSTELRNKVKRPGDHAHLLYCT